MSAADIEPRLAAFAADVGATEPVTPVGSRTHWTIGGAPAAGTREVTAPAGVLEHEPAEMTVRCFAGTTIRELNERLAVHDQMVPFDPLDDASTVGGLLAVGRSGHRRLRYGHVRDLVLQVQYVGHDAAVVTAGGPTVKNVSGYDLCRLLVGSVGTLGVFGELILRCLPTPPSRRWLRGTPDPFATRDLLYRPSSVLWDGTDTWVLLEGDPSDVDAESRLLEREAAMEPCDDGPTLPTAERRSVRPGALRSLAETAIAQGSFVAEIGVGVVHATEPGRLDDVFGPEQPITGRNLDLMKDLKHRFDPTGRLNPGRSLWPTAAIGAQT